MQTEIDDWLNELEISGRQLAKLVYRSCAGDYTRADLAAYIVERKREGWGDASRKIAVNAMRSFFAHACGKRSPARTLPAPRPKPKLQRTLTAAQAFAVLAACDSQTVIGKRDLALLWPIVALGYRFESCAAHLKPDAFDNKGGIIGLQRFASVAIQ